MGTTDGIRVENWGGSIVSYPKVVEDVTNVDQIVAIMKDPERYPSPVRAIGSNHSTTRCTEANGGTVVNMKKMNRILEVGTDTVTVEAGAIYIDIAKELQAHNLLFFVNVELGNMTIGSGSCGGTKDASMPGEFGQVCSYASVIKLVTPSGDLLEVTEDQTELMQVMRSSYGLLGIVYEVTFKVQKLRAMSVSHSTYSLDQFADQLTSLTARGESIMLYMYPFLDKITVEYRKYRDEAKPKNGFAWKIRNLTWKTLAPGFAFYITKLMPFKGIRYFLINRFNRIIQFSLKLIVDGSSTIATDQIIRYPDKSGNTSYTFSIWVFPEETYPETIRAYFAFCKDYYREHGYRCNMLNVGYRISEDKSSLFSYSFDGTILSLDPVSTGDRGWDDFLKAYNQFCSDLGGIPLFNQTKWITPPQAKKAFGQRLETFKEYRKQYDPQDRLLNEYFRSMFE